jgi:FdhE protein
MTTLDGGLQELRNRHPEWQPWLAVIQEVFQQIGAAKWDALVPASARPQESKVPLLAGMTLELDRTLAHRLFARIMTVAGRSGTEKMAALGALPFDEIDILQLFKAALDQDGDRVKEIAAAAGAEPDAFQGLAALLPVPLLHACNRGWARSIASSWTEGYCPLCGAWPAFAEMRGIERNRYLRCARCGSEWQARCLLCPYCGMTDHNELASLVVEQEGAKSVIDTCNRCLGYVKTFTKLQGSAPAAVMLDDLASVELDIAAADRGYRRLQGAGYVLNVNLTQNGTAPLWT